jgi:hypothetical protein
MFIGVSLPLGHLVLVMPGQRNLRRLRKLICAAGHPRLCWLSEKQGVDGRDEPGHDDAGYNHFIRLAL